MPPKARKIKYRGKSMSLKSWASHLGYSYGALRARSAKGWDTNRILGIPTKPPVKRIKYRSTESGGVVSSTPEYHAWKGAIRRCKKTHTQSRYYSDKGITVCKRWDSFETFLWDMGHRPSIAHTLERKNGDKGYNPQNCVWATKKEQSRNRSNNIYLKIDGVRKLLVEWAEIYGVDRTTVVSRLKRGWSPKKSVCGL